MPSKFKRPCRRPGCGTLVSGGYCARHSKSPYDPDRRYRTRLYDTRRWERERTAFLEDNPVCVSCRRRFAKVVDHVLPHRGDESSFWDRTNWQSLCVRCHNAKSAKERL